MNMTGDASFISIKDGCATIRFATSIYDATAVARAAHSLTDKCYVHLDQQSDTTLVRLTPRQSLTNLETCAGRLANEALDYQLRAKLQQQTEPIRRLIIAQAFSRTNLFVPELDRAGVDSDPLNLKGQDHE